MNLTKWRSAEGLTQKQAAALFGITQSVYSRWERGTRLPTAANMACIIDRTKGRVGLADIHPEWAQLSGLGVKAKKEGKR